MRAVCLCVLYCAVCYCEIRLDGNLTLFGWSRYANAIGYHPDAIERSAVFVVVLTLRHVVCD